jgi:hypothetical protein
MIVKAVFAAYAALVFAVCFAIWIALQGDRAAMKDCLASGRVWSKGECYDR